MLDYKSNMEYAFDYPSIRDFFDVYGNCNGFSVDDDDKNGFEFENQLNDIENKSSEKAGIIDSAI